MKNQDKIYIIGHKNPDTDSICSAIAYTDIKNRTSQIHKYIACRAGQINEETEFVLNYFHVQPPHYMPNVGTHVKDMEIHITPDADEMMSVKQAWDLMRENQINTLPIKGDNGELKGLVTNSDIAGIYLDASDSYLLSDSRTQYKKIAETLNGQIITGNEHGYFVEGKILVGTASAQVMSEFIDENDMLILGDRVENLEQAIDLNVSCIIIALGLNISEEIIDKANKKDIVMISTQYDTFSICMLINQSIPVKAIMKKDDMIAFSTEDFTDDIQDTMIKKRHQSFPVINKKGKCVGTISRRNLMNMRKKKVILVDHNEIDQAADNIDQADIVEIVDHHKIGTLQTMVPVSFRNQPVGCTGTILYQLYGEQKLEIAPDIAGLLCSAIISDTLMFRSPTCTLQDKMAAGALALIADINIEEYAKKMFKAGSNLKDKMPEEIFYQDYKKFIAEGGLTFGVGQISSMDEEELMEIKDKLSSFLESEMVRHGVSRIFFMLTNILDESTHLIYCGNGSEDMVRTAFGVEPKDGAFYLKGVVSRKKQLIPALMEAAVMENSSL
ncbi:MAG: putative manganese-dependent inorganic diphosphatase [Blautia sp.]|nr:putative manganese-dependent inorganic diphosphatase [Blautia sp.]